MRLNARLPEELARKLEALERATGQSTSNVVRIALSGTSPKSVGRAARRAKRSTGQVSSAAVRPRPTSPRPINRGWAKA